jgi:hypothetical protein
VAVSTGSLGLINSTEMNKYFIQLKQLDSQLKRITEFTVEAVLKGSQFELYKELGSRSVLQGRGSGPKAFGLSDEEYRQFIARKDVYATYEQMQRYVGNKIQHLNRMKSIMNRILQTLETLD